MWADRRQGLYPAAHRNDPDRGAILGVVARTIVDVPNGEMYIDLVMAVLPKAARDVLENLMTAGTYEYKSEFARRYYERGAARGEAKSLIKILQRRFTVPEAIVDRVMSCTDIDQLDAWTDRALDADSIDQVFGD